jgi:hypothetical protein
MSTQSEKIFVEKYLFERYVDPVHMFGHTVVHNYIVGSPYDITISIVGGTVENVVKGKNITTSYSMKGIRYIPELYKVSVDKDWVDACVDFLQSKEKMSFATAKASENNELISYKTDAIEYFNLGVKAFRESKFLEAFELFNKSVALPSLKDVSLYNSACCCIRLDKITDAIQYLLKSIDSGYSDWNGLLTDPDLIAIIDRVEIVKRFSQYCNDHPDETYMSSSVNDYITRHSIVCNSNKESKIARTQDNDFMGDFYFGCKGRGHSNE